MIYIYMYIDIWQVVEHTYVLQIGDYHNEYAEWRPIPKTQRQSIREQISAAAIGSSSGQVCETPSGQSHEVVVVVELLLLSAKMGEIVHNSVEFRLSPAQYSEFILVM